MSLFDTPAPQLEHDPSLDALRAIRNHAFGVSFASTSSSSSSAHMPQPHLALLEPEVKLEPMMLPAAAINMVGAQTSSYSVRQKNKHVPGSLEPERDEQPQAKKRKTMSSTAAAVPAAAAAAVAVAVAATADMRTQARSNSSSSSSSSTSTTSNRGAKKPVVEDDDMHEADASDFHREHDTMSRGKTPRTNTRGRASRPKKHHTLSQGSQDEIKSLSGLTREGVESGTSSRDCDADDKTMHAIDQDKSDDGDDDNNAEASTEEQKCDDARTKKSGKTKKPKLSASDAQVATSTRLLLVGCAKLGLPLHVIDLAQAHFQILTKSRSGMVPACCRPPVVAACVSLACERLFYEQTDTEIMETFDIPQHALRRALKHIETSRLLPWNGSENVNALNLELETREERITDRLAREKLRLHDDTVEAALQILRNIQQRNLVANKTEPVLVCAAIYLACRYSLIGKDKRMLEDVSRLVNKSPSTVRKVVETLEGMIRDCVPESYLEEFHHAAANTSLF